MAKLPERKAVQNLKPVACLGDDQFTIEATHAGTTSLVLGGGDDTVQVEAITGDTHILGGAGDDVVNVWYEEAADADDDTLHREDRVLALVRRSIVPPVRP